MTEDLENYITVIDDEDFYKVINIKGRNQIHLPEGKIDCDEIRDLEHGGSFELRGKDYYVLECDLHDFIMQGLHRQSQIIYPKESGYIALRLNLGPGTRVGEAGGGSGGLTAVFSRLVGGEGRVYTYERREDFIPTLKHNLNDSSRFDNVIIHQQEVEDGIDHEELDAFFLDLKYPEKVLEEIKNSLRTGGHLGIFLPTTNQVERNLVSLDELDFYIDEVAEIMLRQYKLNPDRFRPEDRMVGHTGYLIFARLLD